MEQSLHLKAIKNPQCNAMIEWVHLTIGDSLCAMNLSGSKFDDTSAHDGILQSITWGLCTTYHTSLCTSLGQLTFGQDMVIPATYLANWHQIDGHCKQNILYDNACEKKTRIPHDYKIGDYTMSMSWARTFSTSLTLSSRVLSWSSKFTPMQWSPFNALWLLLDASTSGVCIQLTIIPVASLWSKQVL